MGLLIVQRIALHLKPLQDRGRDGLFLAQGREGLVARGACSGGGAGLGFGLRGGGCAVAQFLFGPGARVVRLAPAAIQQQPLGLAQLFANGAIARCLPGLTRQLRQLAGQLFDHVVNAGQVGFGALQLQLGLVTALIQAGNPCRLFENAAAGLGFRVDQLGNLPLPHQRRGMRAGRGIGKQHLHVTGAHITGVDLVGTPDIAGNPAHDIQRVVFIEPGRGQPFGIVDMQRNLGKIARRPRCRAGKNHVLHAAAAHRGGAVFAHDPAQRLQQVGLATAVRPDNPGKTIGDDQVCRVDEALEAIQFEFRKTQMEPCLLIPQVLQHCKARTLRVNVKPLNMAGRRQLSTRY